MGSKIVKITKFQNAVKIALVNEFKWNRCQIKALGLIFSIFFWILNFRKFSHVLEHFEHRPDPDFRKKWKIPDLVDFWEESWAKCIKFFQIFFAKVLVRYLIKKMFWCFCFYLLWIKSYSSKRKIDFRIFRILAQTLYKSLTNLYRILKFQENRENL